MSFCFSMASAAQWCVGLLKRGKRVRQEEGRDDENLRPRTVTSPPPDINKMCSGGSRPKARHTGAGAEKEGEAVPFQYPPPDNRDPRHNFVRHRRERHMR